MTDTQDILNLEVGNIEQEKLEAKPVKIESVSVAEIGEKGTKKVVFTVKHPDKPESFNVSGVKFIKKDSVEESGLWVNLDKEGKIQKGSALSALLNFFNKKNVNEFVGADLPTIEDSKGYLRIKAY